MDLSAVIAELNQISARLAENPPREEIRDLQTRQKVLRRRAQAFDVQVRRVEYERELRQLEARVAAMAELEIRHRSTGRGFLRGALWGDYEFPRDAEKLNAQMGDAMDRPALEARIREIRELLGLTAVED